MGVHNDQWSFITIGWIDPANGGPWKWGGICNAAQFDKKHGDRFGRKEARMKKQLVNDFERIYSCIYFHRLRTL